VCATCGDACLDEDGYCPRQSISPFSSEEAVLKTVFRIAQEIAENQIEESCFRHQWIDPQKIKAACLKGFAEAGLPGYLEIGKDGSNG
jgi:hypothetical protein